MSNPSGPDPDATPADEQITDPGTQPTDDQIEPATEAPGPAETDQSAEPTEVLSTADAAARAEATEPTQRRYTAPSGFDAGSTVRIERPREPATEAITVPDPPPPPPTPPRMATPQAIPARAERLRLRHRSWGWVLALILVIAALAAVTILGTVWLTRKAGPSVSQEDLVKETILNFDTAVQKGDLATLRSITCGTNRDTYVNYDDRAWADIHARVAAAKRYPVVASIGQVVVNGEHAEANVTTFMAYDPQIRSTRSFDLQFRDGQWKICQTPS